MSKRSNRTIKWINIVFLAINSSAIISMLILGWSGNNQTEEFDSMSFLRTELNLSDKQYAELKSENDEVKNEYRALIDQSCETNFAIMDELIKETPSVQVLDSLTKKYGALNAESKRQAIKHFLNIRNICNKEQNSYLSKLYKELMGLDKQCGICNKKECPRRTRLKEIN